MRRTVLLLSPALLMAACSGIPQGWAEAKQAVSGGVDGAWRGTWRSDVNGHSGELRAAVTPVSSPSGPLPAEAESRLFRFRASWAKILCAGFDLHGTVKKTGKDVWTMSGSKDLGRVFGGIFTCTGTVRGDEFKARYDAKMDRGVMEMRRVKAGE